MSKSKEDVDLTRGDYRRQYSGFRYGTRICSISLAAEAWFWRVHSVADDYGNMYADPFICHQHTSGRRAREVTVEQVDGFLNEMSAIGLVDFYEVKDERFLHIVAFETMQTTKNGKRVRRFPPCPAESGYVEMGKVGGIQIDPDASGLSGCQHTNTRPIPDQHHTSHSAASVQEPSAEALSDARSFALCWLTSNRPDKLKQKFIRPFVALILLAGKDRAVAESEPLFDDPGIGNPFSYALSLFDEKGNRKPSRRSEAAPGRRQPSRPITNRTND